MREENNIKTHISGFTLIEMAMVLMAMGLLVLVITSANSLVRSAKVRSVIVDVQGFKTAVNAFELRFRGLPGDIERATAFWPGQTTNGDGDRSINYVAGVNEDLRVWQQLGLAGIIPGEYSGQLIGGKLYANENIPPSNLPNSGYRMCEPQYTVYGKKANGIMLGLQGYEFISGAIFTSAESKNIDHKIDDGKASAGMVYTINGWTGYTNNINDPDGAQQVEACVTGNIWASEVEYTKANDPSCSIYFWMN